MVERVDGNMKYLIPVTTSQGQSLTNSGESLEIIYISLNFPNVYPNFLAEVKFSEEWSFPPADK